MKNHRIIAATWQLEAAQQGRLSRVIVPLDIKEEGNTWVYPSEPIDLFWFKGDEIGERLYKALPYQIGDRLYLAEEWSDDVLMADKSNDWQSAATMPPDLAQHWYEVTGVRVVQMAKLTLFEVRTAGLFNPLTDDLFDFNFTTESRWNAAHPDRHWDESRWVVVMDVKEVAK